MELINAFLMLFSGVWLSLSIDGIPLLYLIGELPSYLLTSD